MPQPLSQLLNQRYGDIVSTIEQCNDTIAGLLQHRSIRQYQQTPLASGTLETLVAAGQSAATSSHLQMWSVVAIQDPERKSRLATLAGEQEHIRQAPLFLVFLADLAIAQGIARRSEAAIDGLDYLETFLVGVIDATLAAQNMVIAAESLGLGTVYIGGIRNHPESVAAELGLPPLTFPVFGLVVGHPDPASQESIKPRLPQAAILHLEQYKASTHAQAIADHDEAMKHFQASQSLPARGWSGMVLRRLRDAKALNGRDRLAEALRSFGFTLDR